jgi:hypothetical protein
MKGASPLSLICMAALEQAVLAAESDPPGLETDAAYAAVAEEMIRQAVAQALMSGESSDVIMRVVAEALVSAKGADAG